MDNEKKKIKSRSNRKRDQQRAEMRFKNKSNAEFLSKFEKLNDLRYAVPEQNFDMFADDIDRLYDEHIDKIIAYKSLYDSYMHKIQTDVILLAKSSTSETTINTVETNYNAVVLPIEVTIDTSECTLAAMHPTALSGADEHHLVRELPTVLGGTCSACSKYVTECTCDPTSPFESIFGPVRDAPDGERNEGSAASTKQHDYVISFEGNNILSVNIKRFLSKTTWPILVKTDSVYVRYHLTGNYRKINAFEHFSCIFDDLFPTTIEPAVVIAMKDSPLASRLKFLLNCPIYTRSDVCWTSSQDNLDNPLLARVMSRLSTMHIIEYIYYISSKKKIVPYSQSLGPFKRIKLTTVAIGE